MRHQVFIDEDEVISLSGSIVEDARLLKSDGHVHVIPRSKIFNHVDNAVCGCKPHWDEHNKREYVVGYAEHQVWVHKSDRELTQ